MATRAEASAEPRIPLSKNRVLRAAVALADRDGIESLSMRRLGQELGVEAMSLYNHVSNKEDVLNGMVDIVVEEVDPPLEGADWATVMRARVLSARRMLLRHPWASEVIVSRSQVSPTMMRYMDTTLGVLRKGGFSVDLAHHSLHVMGSRILGFAQELYDDSEEMSDTPEMTAMLARLATEYPYIAELAAQVTHDDETTVGKGCDDQFEFEFGLDLILDGLERLRAAEASD